MCSKTHMGASSSLPEGSPFAPFAAWAPGRCAALVKAYKAGEHDFGVDLPTVEALTRAGTKMHFFRAQRGARVLLNIPAKFWRISSPDSDERSGTAQALTGLDRDACVALVDALCRSTAEPRLVNALSLLAGACLAAEAETLTKDDRAALLFDVFDFDARDKISRDELTILILCALRAAASAVLDGSDPDDGAAEASSAAACEAYARPSGHGVLLVLALLTSLREDDVVEGRSRPRRGVDTPRASRASRRCQNYSKRTASLRVFATDRLRPLSADYPRGYSEGESRQQTLPKLSKKDRVSSRVRSLRDGSSADYSRGSRGGAASARRNIQLASPRLAESSGRRYANGSDSIAKTEFLAWAANATSSVESVASLAATFAGGLVQDPAEADAAASKLQARIRGRNERLHPTPPPPKTVKGPKNAAFVFVKPHAITPPTIELVKSKLEGAAAARYFVGLEPRVRRHAAATIRRAAIAGSFAKGVGVRRRRDRSAGIVVAAAPHCSAVAALPRDWSAPQRRGGVRAGRSHAAASRARGATLAHRRRGPDDPPGGRHLVRGY